MPIDDDKIKSILIKYIQYIRDVEGTDYILIHDNRYASAVSFTEEEWNILKELASLEEIKNK